MGEAGGGFTTIEGEWNVFAKTPEVAAEFANASPKVLRIVRVMSVLFKQAGKPLIVTDVVRADGGVHQYGRAVDVRSTNLPGAVAENIRIQINSWFPYGVGGDGRPRETIPPLDHPGNASKSTAPHFHVQVRG